MGKIMVSQFISLDGVIEAPQNWHFPYISDDMMQSVKAQIVTADAFLYGRHTYQEFAGYWSTASEDELGIAAKLNSAPKYVVSTTMQTAAWHNSMLIKTNVVDEISRLKQQINGIIGITGSATLIESLLQAHLIDEYQLMVHPIVVGTGKRLFKDGVNTQPLKLVETKVFSGGVILLTYQAAQ